MGQGRKDRAERLAGFRIGDGHVPGLAGRPTREPDPKPVDKEAATAMLAATVALIAAVQERLYAARRWSVLVVLQAKDAGGKDGTIKHVFSGINPQGLQVVSFKAPNAEELAHDFLWRVHRAVPPRGVIGVFNRSHYEEVIVPRLHPDILAAQRLPQEVAQAADLWQARLADIKAFESYLARQGTRIVKVFLHLGEAEQKARLRARLDDPTKLWKFDPADLRERALWSAYQAVYEETIGATSTADAPWYVVPADQKWFARLIVAEILLATLEDLDLQTPEPDAALLRQIDEARKALE